MSAARAKKDKPLKIALVAVIVGIAVAVGVISQQRGARAQDASRMPTYTITHLGTLGGDQSHATGVNDEGQVVGSSSVTGSFSYMEHAFLYDASATPKMKDLGTLGGGESHATGINNEGQVVGWSVTGKGREHAFLYDASATPKMKDLGTLGGKRSYAYGINDKGQVVGTSDTSSGERHAFLYDADATPKMKDLSTVTGSEIISATGINEAGQIVGSFYRSESGEHAFLYDKNATPKIKDLGTLAGSDYGERSYATGVNEQGQVIGASSVTTEDYWKHAFLYDADTTPKMKDLGTLSSEGSMSQSVASGINDKGRVVGSSWWPQRAFLYGDGKMVDLNSLIPPDSGKPLTAATAINDRGQIAGWIDISNDDDYQLPRAFLLTPRNERCTITGTKGNDYLPGTKRHDVICGRGGNDYIVGRGGNDTLRGGPGYDAIEGGAGKDYLYGQEGFDSLQSRDGVRGNDTMNGGGGIDSCRGDRGDTRRDCEAS